MIWDMENFQNDNLKYAGVVVQLKNKNFPSEILRIFSGKLKSVEI